MDEKVLSRRWVVSSFGKSISVSFHRYFQGENNADRVRVFNKHNLSNEKIARINRAVQRYQSERCDVFAEKDHLSVVMAWHALKHFNRVLMSAEQMHKELTYVPDMSPQEERCSYGYLSN